MSSSDPLDLGYASLGLMVRNATTTFDVVSFSRGKRLPGGVGLRAPVLGGPGDAGLPVGTAEIVATILDAHGGLLQELGCSVAPRDFHDVPDGRGGAIRGFATKSENAARAFCIPISRGTASLVFTLLRKTSSGVSKTPLATIVLAGKGAEIDTAQNVIPIDFRAGIAPPVMPNGYIDFERTYSVHRIKKDDPRFDIVITGDGFSRRNIDRFVEEAAAVIKGLRATEPFRSLDKKINYHVLAAVSEQSGISDRKTYPQGRRTYFHSTTEFQNPDIRSAMGTPYPELIKAAVEYIRPWCEIDLVLVRPNLDMWAGYGLRRHGTAYISRGRHDSMESFVGLAAHEAGHVIAKLADEYITCDPYDPLDLRPNVATADQLAAGTIPWRTLARRAGELRPDGGLKLVHRYGDAWNDKNNEPDLGNRDMTRIGAFWGCMYTDPSVDARYAACSKYDDPRGATFFRPSARCAMRDVSYGFCAVCADAVAQAILRNVDARKGKSRRERSRPAATYPPAKTPLAARPLPRT